MAQRIDHIYKLVTVPAVYEFIQDALGAKRARARFINEIIRIESGMKVLDVGCGPASILSQFPPVDYTGIDLNQKHIDFARNFYADRGRFLVGDVAKELSTEAGSFDRVLAFGLLHHLSDAECRGLLKSLVPMLKPGGAIITNDPVRLPKQRLIPRLMIHYDSGLNIRYAEQYLNLLEGRDIEIRSVVLSDLLRIPYDIFSMQIFRKPNSHA